METSYGSVIEASPRGNGEQRIDRTYGYGAIPRPYQEDRRGCKGANYFESSQTSAVKKRVWVWIAGGRGERK
jgi:hypothetical protein